MEHGGRGGSGAPGGSGVSVLLIIAILAVLYASGFHIVGFLIKTFWIIVIGILLIAAIVAGIFLWKRKKRRQKTEEEDLENILNMEIKSPEQEELDQLEKRYGTPKPVQPIDLGSKKKGESAAAASEMGGSGKSGSLSSVFSDDKFQ